MKSKKRRSFVFMTDWVPLIRILSKEETDELFRMIKDLVEGKVVHNPEGERLPEVWEFIKEKLLDNIDHYEEVKERRLANLEKANAKKRSANAKQMRNECDANANHSQSVTDTDTVTVTDTDTVTVTDILSDERIEGDSKGKGKPSRFSPPSLDELTKFILDNGYESEVDPESFFDYYEANGWKVGKNSMKSWQSAVKMWASRERKTKSESFF